MELSTSDAIREAILTGLGVSILPRYTLAMEPEHSALVCLDVEGFPLESHWYLVYPVGKRLPLLLGAIAEGAAQLRDRRLDIVDVARHRDDRVGIDAGGEDPAVPIEDVRALGRQVLRALLLAAGPRD